MRLSDQEGLVFISSKASDGGMGFLTTNPKEGLRNRKRFLQSIGVVLKDTVALNQQHGSEIVIVSTKDKGKGVKPKSKTFQADGLLTQDKGIYLMVLVADCNQIALFDPKQKSIGLIHAGKKGLELKIVKKAVQKMNGEFGTDPADLIVEFGPSIGPCCYMMDIWQEAEEQLEASGALREDIFNPKICTYHTPGYFSHRKFVAEKLPQDSRFITVLGFKAS